jgi:NAD+-dependent farnesol dehydrogenase
MRVLVTGGTGYLGQAIVRALVARGHQPVVFARRATQAGLPGTAIDGDIRNRRAVVGAARDCEAVCHSAALVSIWRPDPREFDDVNVGGLQHALAAVGEHRIARLVYTSSFMARPPAGRAAPIAANDYQRTKVAAHEVACQARNEGVPIVLLYPGVVYGPGIRSEGNLLARLMADHLAGRLPGLVGAGRIWSYAYVDDVAAAHVTAIERAPAGSAFELGGENAPQMRPFEWLRDEMGTKLPRRLPAWLAMAAGLIEEARAKLTGAPPLLTRGAVEIFRHDWPLDSAAAARGLDYRWRPLTDGLPRLLAELAPLGGN